jgi:hypothetical protein
MREPQTNYGGGLEKTKYDDAFVDDIRYEERV